MLNSYIAQIQRFCHDQKQDLLDLGNLTDYVNRARREVAMRSQSIRILTPISGSIISANVTAGGSGYTNPTVVITAPDFPSGQPPYPSGLQATGLAIVQGGVIVAVDIQLGGYGYWQPQITISDPTGTGATVTPNMSFINQLNQNQELYPFSAIDLSSFPGVGSPYMVRSLSVLYSNYRYSLAVPSFTVYQGLIRNYPNLFAYTPFYAAQFGRGSKGSLFVYPLPNAAYQFEIDLCALPQDLIDDQSVEVLPEPFTDAVPFLGAYYAMNELQNWNAARFYKGEFDEWMKRYGSYINPGRIENVYGRSIT